MGSTVHANEGEIDRTTEPALTWLERSLRNAFSNRHRGYAPLRPGGGVHPVRDRGGLEFPDVAPGESFDDARLTAAEWLDLVKLGTAVTAPDAVHVVPGAAFDGHILPGQSWACTQIQFEAASAAVPTVPRPVVGQNHMRLDGLLKCVSATGGAIYIAPSQNLTPTNGYPLAPGETVAFNSIGGIWAISTATATATLAWISTNRDGA